MSTLPARLVPDRLRGDPTAPMVYALGTRGAEVLVERGYLKDVGDWRRKNQDLHDRYVAHLTMITNFRIALAPATRGRRDVRLLSFHREGPALRDRVTVARNGRRQVLPFNPDGLFGLQFLDLPEGRNRAFFFLEAGRSTMTRERFLQKLTGYWDWFCQDGHTRNHGIRAFRVLPVTQSEERMESLLAGAAQTREHGDGLRLFWFSSEKRFVREGPASVFEAVWARPSRPNIQETILPEGSTSNVGSILGFPQFGLIALDPPPALFNAPH